MSTETNEITAFAPLLDTLTSTDLTRARGDRVPARRPGHPGHPPHPPGLQPHRATRALAHRDRLHDHRPAPHQARPDELAAWSRGHWEIENGCTGSAT